MSIHFLKILCFLLLFQFARPAWAQKEEVDLIVYNAFIYTMDAKLSEAHIMAIKNGYIVGIGKVNNEVLDKFYSKNMLNLDGKYILPGFNDAHCHFYGLGTLLMQADLRGSKSFQEVLQRLQAYRAEPINLKKKWILGRGWDQNLWPGKEYPSKEKLDSLFPKTPVLLKRVDGHAALANSKALKMARIQASTRVDGGEIMLGPDGQPNGILIDNAVDLLEKKIPKLKEKELETALLDAQRICFSYGVTSVQDAGLEYSVVKKMDQMQQAGQLKIRMYAMLNPTEENFKNYVKKGVYKNGRLHVQAIKMYADGALGSRGACLLKPYADKPGHYGFLLHDTAYFRSIARRALAAGYQLNTHCIGDSANKLMLDIYGDMLKEPNDKRWRIEHAQIVQSSDWPRFAQYSVLPSVQPTHVSSDKDWVISRLGAARLQYAYPFRSLLRYSKRLPLGTDFPVEEVNPMATLYSAVLRTRIDQHPEGGFQTQEALNMYEALKGITYWPAYASFEEKEKGCLERGKMADFVVLDGSPLGWDLTYLFKIKVLATYIHGEKVFGQ